MHEHSIAVERNGSNAADANTVKDVCEREDRFANELAERPRTKELVAVKMERVDDKQNAHVGDREGQDEAIADNLQVSFSRRNDADKHVPYNANEKDQDLQRKKDDLCGIKTEQQNSAMLRRVCGVCAVQNHGGRDQLKLEKSVASMPYIYTGYFC